MGKSKEQNKIILKSMLIWIGIIPIAIINGGLREVVLSPLLGKPALPISGFLLAAMVFLLAYLLIPRIGKGKQVTYIKMGINWIAATIVFEFSLGFSNGESLEDMLSAYNILTGNLWLLVVVFTGFAPWLIAKIKKII